MSTKNPLRLGEKVICTDTKVKGMVIRFDKGLPVVMFEDGAKGTCAAAKRLSE